MAFLGISEFKWFIGVVEDRHDPEKLGRLRVRCLGIHTSDKNIIATADWTLTASLQAFQFIQNRHLSQIQIDLQSTIPQKNTAV